MLVMANVGDGRVRALCGRTAVPARRVTGVFNGL